MESTDGVKRLVSLVRESRTEIRGGVFKSAETEPPVTAGGVQLQVVRSYSSTRLDMSKKNY